MPDTLPVTPFQPAPYVPSAKRPSAISPQAPQTPCTDTAPQGSSTWATLSQNQTLMQTSRPATPPMIAAANGATKAQGAVIATSPANMPLHDMEMSGLPYL